MKVVCERAALLHAVNNVAGVVPTRSTIPTLSCVKIVATKNAAGGALHVTGSDNETSLQLTVTQVDVVQPGTAVVSADRLRAIVQAVEHEPTLTLSLDRDMLNIHGGASRFRMFTTDPAQYPALPELAGPASSAPAPRAVFTLPAGILTGMINRTVFATARETTRYAINGVLLKLAGKKIEMVATDGRRLAVCRSGVKVGGGDANVSCIIPTRSLNLVQRLAANPDETIRVTITDNRVLIAFEPANAPAPDEPAKGKKDAPAATSTPAAGATARAVLASTLVEGVFPPYEDVIPRDQDKKATLDREGLLARIREAAVLTNEESRGVRLAFNGKDRLLRMTSRAPEMGEAEVDVQLTGYEGEDLEISFNPLFLADALKTVDEPEVLLELKAPNKPGVLKSGAEFTYVVMPVNLPG